MRPENEAKLRKIRAVSAVLRVICKAFAALIAVGFLMATVALLANRGGSVGYFDVWFRIGDLTLGRRLAVLAMVVLTSAVWLKCFYHLHQLFGNYSRGEIFTSGSIGQLRQVGIACVLWGVMKVSWVALSRAFSGHPSAPVQVGAEMIPIGAIIVAVAWFMAMAVEMREENELTV
jgi:hypothetical protein